MVNCFFLYFLKRGQKTPLISRVKLLQRTCQDETLPPIFCFDLKFTTSLCTMLKASGKRVNGVALLSLLLFICLTFDLFTRVIGSGLNIQRSSNSRNNLQHSNRAEIAKALVHSDKKKRKEIPRAEDDSCTYRESLASKLSSL